MAFDYNFMETEEEITLIFYVPPIYFEEPSFALRTPTRLICDGVPITLFKPVSDLRITRRTSRIFEIQLRKETPGRWYSVSGPTKRDAPAPDVPDEPEKAPDNVFKLLCKIYADGGDDVKRAMNKSLQESGGTVLNTNWDDVKKGKVHPPE